LSDGSGKMSPTNGKKVALITGVCGQDGSYLAELLLSKGYIVHGKLTVVTVAVGACMPSWLIFIC